MPLDQFLLTASLRAAAILVIACGLAPILSLCRSSAAARHKLWALALGASLAVPLIVALLPAWRVSLPWASTYPLSSSLLASSPGNPPPQPTRTIYLLASTESPRNPPAQSPPESSALSSEPDSANSPGAEPLAPAGIPSPIRFTTWLVAAWCLGAFLAICPLLLGFISLRQLKRSSRAVTEGRLHATLRQAAQQFGIKRPIQLLLSPARAMPMTWGTWRPTILLPASAESWTDQRLQAVLLHELAHVARRDCFWQMVAQLARAMYWFNPLAWLAERQLRIEQERACDDLVLSHDFDPPDYADHLLAISASCSPYSGSAAALAMSHSSISNPSNLESRLMAILNPRLNRSAPSRRFARIMAASAMAATVLISATRFEAVTANDAAANQNANQNPPAAIALSDGSKALAELRTKIAEQSAKPVNDNEIMRGAIKGMIESLRDPYADYLTPDALSKLEQQIRGSLVGIGAQLEMHEKQIRIVTPLPGSPALKAGLQPGDTILEIDGQSTTGLELSEAVKRIVGAAGSKIRLTIGRENNQKTELNVTRGPINLPTIRAFRASNTNEPDFLLDAVNKIGYIQIDQFASATPQETRAAIESLYGASLKGLILDLRNCPGGMLDSAVGVAKIFLSDATIVSIHRSSEKTEIRATAPAFAGDLPLILLVNSQTASAAEILVGALQDNQRAKVLGTRTLGKGSIQSLIKLDSENGAIKLTTSEYRLPSGRSIDKRPGEQAWGIDPDEGFFVPLDHQQSKAMLQRRLQRQVIGGKAAADGNRAPPLTPAVLEQQENDPQLAAALKALIVRIQSGSFAKINNLTAAQAEQLVHRAQIKQRRETAAQALEQLDRELAELN